MSNFCGGFDSGSRPAYFQNREVDRQSGSHREWSFQGYNEHYGSGKDGGGTAGGHTSARTMIKDLAPYQPNTLIVGIVVTKQGLHSFPDKKNPGSRRFKFSFTLRDSPSDYINATCWGSEEYIRRLFDSFKICDVVELQNGQIVSKSGGENEERWRPWTPSQYQINVSEIYSTLSLYNGWDYTEFTALAHVPLRPPNDYYPLSDISASGQSLDSSHINILAIVKNPGTPKQMTSKSGKPLKKCEVKLTDEGCPTFSLFLWDEELIELAQTWTPKENIIFAADVKVTYDTYRNCMIGTCDQKTLIITNPDCREAHQLYQFAQTLGGATHSQEEGGNINDGQDDVQSISQVYTVEELKRLQMDKSYGGASFSGILFAFLTSFTIDEDPANVVCCRCTSCKFRVDEGATYCQNRTCPTVTSGGFTSEPHYSILISLSDHTGGIDSVRLSGQPASDLLQQTPHDFLSMSDTERTELKCSLLLEKFKVYFKSGMVLPEQRRPSVRVLLMSLADPEEATSSLEK